MIEEPFIRYATEDAWVGGHGFIQTPRRPWWVPCHWLGRKLKKAVDATPPIVSSIAGISSSRPTMLCDFDSSTSLLLCLFSTSSLLASHSVHSFACFSSAVHTFLPFGPLAEHRTSCPPAGLYLSCTIQAQALINYGSTAIGLAFILGPDFWSSTPFLWTYPDPSSLSSPSIWLLLTGNLLSYGKEPPALWQPCRACISPTIARASCRPCHPLSPWNLQHP